MRHPELCLTQTLETFTIIISNTDKCLVHEYPNLCIVDWWFDVCCSNWTLYSHVVCERRGGEHIQMYLLAVNSNFCLTTHCCFGYTVAINTTLPLWFYFMQNVDNITCLWLDLFFILTYSTCIWSYVSYLLSVLSQYHCHWGPAYSGPVSDLQGKDKHKTIGLPFTAIKIFRY